MSNLNSLTRKKLYAFLVQRDGEYCRGCGKLPHEGQLVIDHKNNDSSYNRPENLQLLCRRCNYLKNPRRPFDLGEGENGGEDESELHNSKKNEPRFREYVFRRINENNNKPIPEKDLVFGGAELVGNSPTTCKRYLSKMCSSEGFLRRWRPVETIVVGYKVERNYV